jgi:hypothetical protein
MPLTSHHNGTSPLNTWLGALEMTQLISLQPSETMPTLMQETCPKIWYWASFLAEQRTDRVSGKGDVV